MTDRAGGAAASSDRLPADPIVRRLEDLSHLYPRLIDLSLGRIEGLLNALGRPQDRLSPVIHIAGTNGKGSVLAFLRAMLEAAGYSVHAYTSPHLVSYTERIRLNGRLAEERAVLDAIDRCARANGDRPITQFEIGTAAAFLLFAEHPADVLLLETGLGGRLDATNVVRAPLAAAITAIGMDHMDFLGDTVETIAGEKAGILKPGCPAVLGPQRYPTVHDVIAAQAASVGANLRAAGADWAVIPRDDGGFDYNGGVLSGRYPAPALAGAHQVENAATALATLESAGLGDLPVEAAIRGLQAAQWPARLQRLKDGPLPPVLPPDWSLWLDGGHNADAGRAIATYAAQHWADTPLHLVVGVIKTKDARALLAPLRSHAASLTAVPIPDNDNALTPDELAAIAHGLGFPRTGSAASAEAAIRALVQDAGAARARILICGSLYLAGAILAQSR